MNLVNVLVVGIIAVLLVLDVRYLYTHRGQGGCSGSCSSCGTSGASCKWSQDIEKAKREISAKRS